MKIYTKTGDDGTTGLVGGDRVQKTSSRIRCLGAIDHLNASLGLARSHAPEELADILSRVQSQLFDLGAEIATPAGSPYSSSSVSEEDSRALEAEIDLWTGQMEPLRNFILPGGTEFAARLHLARTVCRDAEILLLECQAENQFRAEPLIFVNRLSDWLFTLARFANHMANQPDIKWLGRLERKS